MTVTRSPYSATHTKIAWPHSPAKELDANGEAAEACTAHTTDAHIFSAGFTAMIAHEMGAPVATLDRDMFDVRLRDVSLESLLVDVSSFARTLPGEHPMTITLSGNEQVWADPERIGQVLRNLLGNAAKHSSRGAAIELRACRLGNDVRIQVKDSGYGIHPDDVARIFHKFGRGRDRQGSKVHGTGLGLYVCQQIIAAHHSEMTVESTLDAGSVFGFNLKTVT